MSGLGSGMSSKRIDDNYRYLKSPLQLEFHLSVCFSPHLKE